MLTLLTFTSCKDDEQEIIQTQETNTTMTDGEGNTYKTVTIGTDLDGRKL